MRQWIAEAQAASASHVAQQMQQFKLVVFVKVVGISPLNMGFHEQNTDFLSSLGDLEEKLLGFI